MKKFIKQTALYSVVFGALSFVAPVSVAAKDVKQLNLYGIDTGLIVTNQATFSEAQIIALVASVIAGAVLIANGKVIRRMLTK